MLITFVQGVISAFDKYLGPLTEAGGKKSRKHTDHHFLGESRVHGIQGSILGAIPRVNILPKPPLFRLHYPEPEKQICRPMRQDA